MRNKRIADFRREKKMAEFIRETLLPILAVAGLLLLLSLLGGFAASLIWNYVVVALFSNLPKVTWWQAWLIMFLINLVFGHVNGNK